MTFPPHVEEILRKRYYLSGGAYKSYYGEDGEESTWSEVSQRVASVVAPDETKKKDYFDLINSMTFIPNSPTLFGAGVRGLTLSACFVMDLEDSIDGWGDAFKVGMKVQTAGGGVGWPLSKLRPKGSPVSGRRAKAAGPIEFMRCWNEISKAFSQAVRNGANMGFMMVDHPDIEEFISCKSEDGVLSTFNISVGITTEFIKCVMSGDKFPLVWNGVTHKEVDAAQLWRSISEAAHSTGEPGIVFFDRVQRDNLHPDVGDLYPNPCAEATLLPFCACNLGSINLVKFVKDGQFDFDALSAVVARAYPFLDDLIDVNQYPAEIVDTVVNKFRPIGLGAMGLADVFLRMRIRYGDKESRALTSKIFKCIRAGADATNTLLAEQKGSYPACGDTPLRNSLTTTVAPTGTISMIAGVSSGIEPVFSFSPIKRNVDGVLKDVYAPYQTGDPLLDVSAMDISVGDHLAIVSEAQPHMNMSISKTINLPSTASVEAVEQAFKGAYSLGLKCVTVYRDGSRENQTLVTSASYKTGAAAPPLRSGVLSGYTSKVLIGCGKLYVTVNNDDDGNPIEIFVRPGKTGGCASNAEALGRLASLSLRSGGNVSQVIEQLHGIRCMSCVSQKVGVLSCPDAMARVLKNLPIHNQRNSTVSVGVKCPECDATLTHESGCIRCLNCGFSRC